MRRYTFRALAETRSYWKKTMLKLGLGTFEHHTMQKKENKVVLKKLRLTEMDVKDPRTFRVISRNTASVVVEKDNLELISSSETLGKHELSDSAGNNAWSG